MGFYPVKVPPNVVVVDESGFGAVKFVREKESIFVLVSNYLSIPEGRLFEKMPLGGRLEKKEEARELFSSLIERVGKIDAVVLLVPDVWYRLAIIEVENFPHDEDTRLDVIRWKLKKSVPVRPEELRIDYEILREDKGITKLLLGFCSEQFLSDLENLLESFDIKVGWITNETVSAYRAVKSIIDTFSVSSLLLASKRYYTLTVFNERRPVIYRFKKMVKELDEEEKSIRRDLRLTAVYIREKLGINLPERNLVVAEQKTSSRWGELLKRELGGEVEIPPLPIPPTQETLAQYSFRELLPLMGAAMLEVE